VDSLAARGPEETRAAHRKAGAAPLTVADVDGLPFPTDDRDELRAYSFTSYPLRMACPATRGFVLSSRGCPHGCTFCSPVMRKTSGRAVRLRTTRRVVDEIEHLMNSGVSVVSFEDDDLTARRERVERQRAEKTEAGQGGDHQGGSRRAAAPPRPEIP